MNSFLSVAMCPCGMMELLDKIYIQQVNIKKKQEVLEITIIHREPNVVLISAICTPPPM